MACRCSVSFLSIFITCFQYIKKAAECDFFDKPTALFRQSAGVHSIYIISRKGLLPSGILCDTSFSRSP